MAFWLKAAEGLFEEVDRRAKQVVGELSDQQIEAQIAASEQDVIGRAEPQNSTGKRSNKTSVAKPLAKANGSQKDILHVTTHLPESNSIAHRDGSSPSQENSLVKSPNTNQPVQINQDVKLAESAVSELVKLSLPNDNNQKNNRVPEYPPKEDKMEAVSTSTAGDLQGKTFDTSSPSVNTIDSLATPELDHGAVECNFSAESGIVKVELLAKNAPSMETTERTGIISGNETDKSRKEFNEEKAQEYDSPKPAIQNERPKEETPLSVIGVEDQLDEAQGVLKTAVSTGQSKEARLAKVCAGLSSRLQEYKFENAQLEELLAAERKERKLCDARIKQLEQEISLSKAATSAVEAGMADALASKNAEIELLMTSMESLKKQATVAEGKLVTLQANTEAVMRNQKLTETRMIQTLREELASTERRAEEERAAHNATRMAAMEREAELEQRAAEASAALAKIQLRDWLDLSLNHSVPSSLLILSRAFTVSGKMKPEEAVQATLSSLPEEVVDTVGATSLPSEDTLAERKRKLEYLEMQEELIKEEEEKEEEQLARLKDEAASQQDIALQEMNIATAREAQELAKSKAIDKEERLCKLSRALAVLASASSVSGERAEFLALVNKEIELYNSMVDKEGGEGEEATKKAYRAARAQSDTAEITAGSKVSSSLINRVDAMLQNLEKELDDVDAKIGDRWRILDRDYDGKVTAEELASAALYLKDTLGQEPVQDLISNLAKDRDGKILVEDIVKLGTRTDEGDIIEEIPKKKEKELHR